MTPGPDDRAPRPRQRIYLVGYYGVDNLGDEAIRTSIEGAAETLGATVVRYATRDRTDPDPRAVPLRWQAAPRHIAAIAAADRVVLGGGGILKDEGLRVPLELAAIALTARLLRRRVSLLAVGVGPFYHRTGRWLVRLTARLAQVRTVRDDDSAAALARLGVRRVAVGADPIFTTPPATGVPAPPPAGERRVVLSVRPWFHTMPDAEAADAARSRLHRAVAAATALLRASGHTPRGVALYWPRDRDELERIDPGVTDAGRLDWDALLAEMRAADLVIAMRYHAVAAAALTGRPTIALAYEPKVAELGRVLGITTLDVAGASLEEAVVTAVRTWQVTGAGAPEVEAVDALRTSAWRIMRAALFD